MPIEFQNRPDVQPFGRLLEYLGRLWLELRPARAPEGLLGVVAAVINLTGTAHTSRDMIPPGTSLRTCLAVAERNLAEQVANEVLIWHRRWPGCALPAAIHSADARRR